LAQQLSKLRCHGQGEGGEEDLLSLSPLFEREPVVFPCSEGDFHQRFQAGLRSNGALEGRRPNTLHSREDRRGDMWTHIV
jgi:hypothetical protein